jgi:hypothetical protein
MADLKLSGNLNLSGILNLVADGGKVKVGGAEVLVVSGQATGTGIPVIQPPPPATPLEPGTDVTIISSFNGTVTASASRAAIVAQGICMQGTSPTWPGIVLPSSNNRTVMIAGTPANVAGDFGVTLPNGGTVTFDLSGQQ